MNKIKAMITQVLDAPDVVPALARYIAGQTGRKEKDIIDRITKETGGLEGKQFIRKFYSAEKIDVVDSERSVVGVISTSSKDRDREVVDPQGAILSDYQKNRVVLYGHDYHGLPIGRNMWIKRKGNALIAKTEFARRPDDLPDSQPWLPDQVYHLMKEGMLNGFSIGFIPLEERELEEAETKSGVERAWSKWLMLEYSIVAVPSNPEAVAIEIKSGRINHQQLIDDLVYAAMEIEIEENDMKTEKEAPKEEQVTRIEIAENSIWADLKEGGPEYSFNDTWSEKMQEAWKLTYGEQVKDILEDEVIKGEDGLPDPALLKEAIAKLDIETGEIEIEDKEASDNKPEEEDEKEEDPGEIEGEAGEGTPPEATPGSEEIKTVGEVMVKVSLDAVEFMEQMKILREEITEIKEGKVLSKSTRSLVEQAVTALQELLEKADSRAVTEEIQEEEIEIEEKQPAPEEPLTKEQIKELLSTPEIADHIKGLMARHTGKM